MAVSKRGSPAGTARRPRGPRRRAIFEEGARLGGAFVGGGPEAGRVGVDPDDDLGPPRLDGGREAGAEGEAWVTSGGAGDSPAPPWVSERAAT